jgi:hypothetical protein
MKNLYQEPVSLLQDSAFLVENFPSDTIIGTLMNEKSHFFRVDGLLTFGIFSQYLLEAFRQAPFIFYQYPEMLPKVCTEEGTLAGRNIFDPGDLSVSSPIWQDFRDRVLLPIIRNARLREKAWHWLVPYYRQVFQSMPRFHQQVYRDMIIYLSDYYNHYSMRKVEDQLEVSEENFAYEHWDGTTSPFRKVSALLDRLILIYGVIDEKEVRNLVNQAHREMGSW